MPKSNKFEKTARYTTCGVFWNEVEWIMYVVFALLIPFVMQGVVISTIAMAMAFSYYSYELSGTTVSRGHEML